MLSHVSLNSMLLHAKLPPKENDAQTAGFKWPRPTLETSSIENTRLQLCPSSALVSEHSLVFQISALCCSPTRPTRTILIHQGPFK